MSKNRSLQFLLILLLLADFIYTFKQNLGKPLDGDIVPITLPSAHYQKVMENPFGFRAIFNNEKYAAPNRYFAHATMTAWYRNVYNFTGKFIADPIQRLYFISAVFNTFTQFFLIFLIAVYIAGHAKFWQKDFLIAAAVVTPFFQVHGFYTVMGITDQAVTYTFFYAFPLALLLLFFLPFYLPAYHKTAVETYFKKYLYPAWILLAIYICLGGTLIPPIVLLSCFVIVIGFLVSRKQALTATHIVPAAVSINFLWIGLLSLYSFYLGTFNAENLIDMPLSQRYLKLMEGLAFHFTHQPAFPLMLLLLAVNAWIYRKYNSFAAHRNTVLYVLLFILLYIFLLPLGGYRSYRPLVLRYDTMMPVTLVFIFACGITTYFCLKILQGRKFISYLVFFLAIACVFTIVDKPQFSDRACQEKTLYQIRQSTEQVTYVGNQCNELTWGTPYDTAWTRNISEMLYQWKVTDRYKAIGGKKQAN